MYKVTISKNVQDEFAPMLTITERQTHYFDTDSAALLFCEKCTTHGFSITEYKHLISSSVNFAISQVYSKFNIDIS